MNYYKASLELHKKLGGKLEIRNKKEIETQDDLSLLYTPGVAQACLDIAKDPRKAYDLTIKRNTIAIVSDGSAVLGLGNIGPEAAMPVMEGKAMLFKAYAGVDAFPICVATQDTDEIIRFVKQIAPTFAGVNLEDIAAPRAFYVEEGLQDIGIPVFHDDQHGTAIVLRAALVNATKLVGKPLETLRIVISGAGAAGTAIANLLQCSGYDSAICTSVCEILVCDSKGIIHKGRRDISGNEAKMRLAKSTNKEGRSGSLADAIIGADVFIGVSKAGLLTQDMVRSMAEKAIVFAMANPEPEIMPKAAHKAGAFIVGTGRSDFPNQVNNVLAFPGIFRGALDARAPMINEAMKIAAAEALAGYIEKPTRMAVIPSPLDKGVAPFVAKAVSEAWKRGNSI
ncbi:MAG: NAD(P)-dependent malic enzyme [Calditrichia bacterium]